MRPCDLVAATRRRTPTLRQRMILDWIADFAAVHGRSPSVREIGRAFGIRSTNCVSKHLRALERKGCLKRTPSTYRGLAVVHADSGLSNTFPTRRSTT